MTDMLKLFEPDVDLTLVEGGRRKVLMKDKFLTVARIIYQPGESNEFHHHDGTSQALYVIRGQFSVFTRHPDGSVSEKRLLEGDAALVAPNEEERFVNTGDVPSLVYQVTHTGGEVVRSTKEK